MLKIKLFNTSYIALAPPLTYANALHASLTEENLQWDVITSELGTCVLIKNILESYACVQFL